MIYTPDIDLRLGENTVKLEVSDMAHKEGNVSEKSTGARKANMAVHEFSFFVEDKEALYLHRDRLTTPTRSKMKLGSHSRSHGNQLFRSSFMTQRCGRFACL